jgi:phenylacetate-CoA ligase
VSKEDLLAAWSDTRRLNRALSCRHPSAFQTRSSGSSGMFVTVAQDRRAVLIDTLQGIRQLERQSGSTLRPHDLLLQIYTCPWWFSSVGGSWRSAFVSSLRPSDEILATIRCLRPAAISLYPSTLVELASRDAALDSVGVRLVIVHSEQSCRSDREDLSRRLGVPVLDEYSSEELTRIALECPRRRYHLEEDAAFVEIARIASDEPVAVGQLGEVLGTNMNNRATPLIRYRQGDLGRLGDGAPCGCGSRFRVLDSLEGRLMDAFATPSGGVVPGGALMDAAYHRRLSLGVPVHGLQYRMVQEAIDRVVVYIVPPAGFDSAAAGLITRQLRGLLGPGVNVAVHTVTTLPSASTRGKPRPIVSLLRPKGPERPSL